MHTENLSNWTHDHIFDTGNDAAERSTRIVMWITAAMMVVEIAAGWWYNSMALLADGWHMSSHAVAIGLSAFAYATARRYAKDPRFAFGTWKIEIVRRCDRHRFVVLPKRWIVERTIGWISRNRRLARDFERHCRIAAAFVRMAMIRIMLRRLAAMPSA